MQRRGVLEVQFYSFLTSILNGVGDHCHALGKTPPVPIVQEVGRAPSPVCTGVKKRQSLAPHRVLNPELSSS